MNRRTLGFAFLLITAPLFAQTGHLVSRIDVRGGRAPAALIISQTALEVGRTYSDRDLEIAVARIRRLPFIYDARYSMEGETLILEIDTVTRFFADVDVEGSSFPGDNRAIAVVGGGTRLYVGSGGVAEVTLTKLLAEGGSGRNLGLEYSHYGIAGTRLFASASILQSFFNDEGFEPDPTWNVAVGYPLTIRQTLTASASGQGFTSESSFGDSPGPNVSVGSQRSLDLRWTYDTTDDPFFALQGLVINVTPSLTDVESEFEGFTLSFPGPVFTPATRQSEGTITRFNADATKYWPIGERNVLLASLDVLNESSDITGTFNGQPVGQQNPDTDVISLTLGAARNLFDWSAPLDHQRHRIELGFRASRTMRDEPGRTYPDIDSKGITAAWLLRRQYLNLRLRFSYDFD